MVILDYLLMSPGDHVTRIHTGREGGDRISASGTQADGGETAMVDRGGRESFILSSSNMD